MIMLSISPQAWSGVRGFDPGPSRYDDAIAGRPLKPLPDYQAEFAERLRSTATPSTRQTAPHSHPATAS